MSIGSIWTRFSMFYLPFSCSASSSSLFMTLVASELPEVPSDLSPVLLEFDKRRGSWWPENRTEEKILHIRKSRVSHNKESFVEIFGALSVKGPKLSIHCKPCLKYHVKGRWWDDCDYKASHKNLSNADKKLFSNYVKSIRGNWFFEQGPSGVLHSHPPQEKKVSGIP